MHMTKSGNFKYLVQGRCSLIHWPEFRMLAKENATSIAMWIFQDIICRWGALREIVTDNGPAFLKALAILGQKYKIRHIRISGYNSRANGLVERSHFDVRQALFKAADGDEAKWSQHCYSVFWAERITIRKMMGCSPYFAATGTHPLIPLDIVEATYLQPPPESILSTTDLIARRAIALQRRKSDLSKLHTKVFATRKNAAIRFEKKYMRTIHNFDFKNGDLVLMRNTAIEYALDRKLKPRYLGPLVVVSRNKGGAYIICELDGAVMHRPIAAFRLIPYHARQTISLPADAIDIDTKRLRQLEEIDMGTDEEEPSNEPDDTDSDSEIDEEAQRT